MTISSVIFPELHNPTPRSTWSAGRNFVPITLLQSWKFFLKLSWCSSYKCIQYATYIQLWCMFNVHVNLIRTYNTFHNFYSFSLTNFEQKFTTKNLNTPLSILYPYFVNQNNMASQMTYSMAHLSLITHTTQNRDFLEILKCSNNCRA